MIKIYIVEGSTGEYSNHTTWFFKAYAKEILAVQAAQALNLWALQNNVSSRCQALEYDELEKVAKKCPDPNCSIDYNGVQWTVCPCDFEQ